MQEWWNSIPAFDRIFWYFAIPFTVLLSIQTVLTLTGISSDGFDFDDDGFDTGAGFPIFTIKNFIIFFTIFGWTGIAASSSGMSNIGTLILSVVISTIVMFLVAGIFYFMSRMTQSGNINLQNAVGSIGEVYIPIPGKRSGTGKIQIQIQGAVREINAITDDSKLATGTTVKVLEVINNQILLVDKI